MAVYTVIGRVVRQRLSTTVYTTLVYGAGCLTAAALAAGGGVSLTGYDPVNLWIGLGLAVFCTRLGHSVFSWGLRYVKASYVSTVKFLEPAFAALWGYLAFREVPSISTLMGAAVILAGVLLYSSAEA